MVLILTLEQASKLPLLPESCQMLRMDRLPLKTRKCDTIHELSDTALAVLQNLPTLRKWRLMAIHDGKLLYPANLPPILKWRAKWHFMLFVSAYLLKTRCGHPSSVKASLRMLRSRLRREGRFSRGFRDP